jgi:hypothetical protein
LKKLLVAPVLHAACKTFLNAVITASIQIISKVTLSVRKFRFQRNCYSALQSSTVKTLWCSLVSILIVSSSPRELVFAFPLKIRGIAIIYTPRERAFDVSICEKMGSLMVFRFELTWGSVTTILSLDAHIEIV